MVFVFVNLCQCSRVHKDSVLEQAGQPVCVATEKSRAIETSRCDQLSFYWDGSFGDILQPSRVNRHRHAAND